MAKPHCCSLWLCQAYIGALPYHASRHDSPCRPHSLTALLSSVMSGQDGTVLVSIIYQFLDNHFSVIYLMSDNQFLTFQYFFLDCV